MSSDTLYYRTLNGYVVRERDGEWSMFVELDRDWRVMEHVTRQMREVLTELPADALDVVEVNRAARLTRVRTMHRSVSQIQQYERCPHAFYLQRVERAWQRPAAWLPHGLAVHKAVEMIERSSRQMPLAEAEDVFREEYADQTNRLASDGVSMSWWFPSGPYDGPADVERRYGLGLEQVGRYDQWIRSHPEDVIWMTPDGEPAIELGFDIELDGVQMIGYIDQVIADLGPRDVKSGATPGDSFQLAAYAVAIEEQYGVRFLAGDYWMGKTGKATKPYDLTVWPRNAVADRLGAMDAAVKAEQFDPKPDPDTCRMCSVQRACAFSLA